MEANVNDYTVAALIKELGTSQNVIVMNCQKKIRSPSKEKASTFFTKSRNKTSSGQEPWFSYTGAQMTHLNLFHFPNHIGNVTYKSFSTNLPSCRKAMRCSHEQHCCASIPHRPLFPGFAKDDNAASIAIGSNYARSQQFS